MRPLRAAPVIGLILLAAALGLAPGAHAQSDLARARLVTLPNGLRLLLAPDSTATAVEVASWFDAGGEEARPGPAGLARLLEHLMAREGPARRVANQGGTAGSFTSPDVVCFFETLPAGDLGLGLAIEAERLRSLTVTASDLDRARARLAAERESRAESGPAVLGMRRLYDLITPTAPYRRGVSGEAAALASLTPRDCEDAFRARFGPGQALVTIVGAFEPEAALREARRTLGAVPARGVAARPTTARPGAAHERRATERLEMDLQVLFAGWRGPAESDPDAVPLDLLGRVIGTGSESRLMREAVGSDRDFLFAQGGYDGHQSAGLFYALGVLRPGADSAAAERGLSARVEKLATEPVTAEELERARRQAEGGILFAWQGVHGRTLALGMAQIVDGDYHGAWTRLERLRALAAADLQRAAARVLKPENRGVVWLVPGGTPGPAPAPPAKGSKR